MKFVCIVLSILFALQYSTGMESSFQDLLRRGKSILSRSNPLRKFEISDDPVLFPEHREEFHSEELEDSDHVVRKPLNAYSYSPQQHHPHKKEHTENHYKGVYRTDIIENDNMDLYSLIGGISFASFLATTLFILSNRRNGSLFRSLDEVVSTEKPYREVGYISPYHWSREKHAGRMS